MIEIALALQFSILIKVFPFPLVFAVNDLSFHFKLTTLIIFAIIARAFVECNLAFDRAISIEGAPISIFPTANKFSF